MNSIRKVFRTPARKLDDSGVAMIVVIGYGMVIMLIMSLLSVYALNSMRGARREQDYTAAVAAAQAGVDSVMNQLRKNPAGAASLGTSDWTAVPGSKDSAGNSCEQATIPVNCPQYRYATQVLPGGAVEIHAVGKTRDNIVRAVKVTARQSTFTDYLYYSEVEAADPADGFAYPRLFYPNGGPANCAKRAWPAADARPSDGSCKVPTWRDGDSTEQSRVHTNDVFTMVGTPTFNSTVTTAYDQCAPSAAASPTCYIAAGGSDPEFKQGDPSYSTGLDLAVNAPTTLKAQAANSTGPFTGDYTQGCVYTGPTRILFEGNKMRVWSPQTPYTARCGGGLDNAILDILDNPLTGTLVNALDLDDLIALVPLASPPPRIDIPKNNVIYVQDNPATPNRIYCLLGKVLGITGTLDTNVTQGQCKAGNLFVSGDFDGKLTLGADGDALIMSDLKYSNGGGTHHAHDGSDRLGIVAKGAVEVYNPVQCLLAIGTCLELNNLPAVLPGHSIEVDAAIMSLEHRFGTQLPLLQPNVYASLLNGIAQLSSTTPSIKLYGSVAQRYRGILGADVLDLGVNVDGINVASADVNIGYKADFTYDQHLRDSAPPFFPTPASPGWIQDTFAEIPLGKVPAGLV
jgi:hypothetical protein